MGSWRRVPLGDLPPCNYHLYGISQLKRAGRNGHLYGGVVVVFSVEPNNARYFVEVLIFVANTHDIAKHTNLFGRHDQTSFACVCQLCEARTADRRKSLFFVRIYATGVTLR